MPSVLYRVLLFHLMQVQVQGQLRKCQFEKPHPPLLLPHLASPHLMQFLGWVSLHRSVGRYLPSSALSLFLAPGPGLLGGVWVEGMGLFLLSGLPQPVQPCFHSWWTVGGGCAPSFKTTPARCSRTLLPFLSFAGLPPTQACLIYPRSLLLFVVERQERESVCVLRFVRG